MAPWDTCSQRKVDRLSFELKIIILKYRILWEHDCTWYYSKDGFILHYFEQDFENRGLEKVCVITDQKVEELIMLCIIFCVNKLIITVIIFSKFDWCISYFILQVSFFTVVITQCNGTVGCNWTPLMRQLKQPITLSPLSLIHQSQQCS